MKKSLLVLLPVVAIGLLAAPRAAEAKKSVSLYQYGDMVFEAGDLPKPYNDNPVLSGLKAGYKCKVFGLFWAYIHKWSCEPVAFRGLTYLDKTKATNDAERKLIVEINQAVGKKYKLSDVKMGAWAKHGRILVILGILGLVGWGVYSQLGGKKKDKKDKKDKA
jgi:hypothetical protein